MRTALSLASFGIVLCLGFRADAGMLTSSTLSVQFGTGTESEFPPMLFTATGLTGLGAAGNTHWTLQPGAVPTGTATTTIPLSAGPPLTQIFAAINGNPSSGVFSASTPHAMRVTGVANVRAYGGITLLAVPIQAGVPGTSVPAPGTGVGITAIANSWTTKTTSFVLSTPTANGATVATAMGTNNLAGGQGTVTLVTAVNVVSNLTIPLPTFLRLTLSYVPEPAPLVLALGAALAILAARPGGRR